ncbi:MAG: phosphoenolpyruvate--protein phosphotransferase [Spirochaetia bacterium]|nr:phosphoenolpyruvate--protein phosphotransferase [Spirochaetia bacterium]
MIHGRTGNSGIAVGKVFLKDAAPHPERREVSSTDDEMMRFEKVLEDVRTELRTSVSAADSKAADILEVQLMMLEDESLIESIKEKISGGMNAEYAVYESGNERAQTFEQMDDAYLCARASDMRDIADKIFFALIGHTDCDVPEYPCIYVAEDLTPEQIVKLDKSNILGIVTRKGSANSHTAILAGNYGIPYLFSADFDREKVAGTEYAALDAINGLFILSPDEETQRQLFSMKQNEEKSVLAAADYSGKVKVLANIAKPEDMDAVIAEGADGVGLYRTEFLYMNRNTLPDEEEQFIAYKTVLERMHGKDVTIRTMDIGADKKTGCIKQQDEENPALGKRAIRICLMDTELFRTQLRALLRAAVYGNEYIMYPMISSENEIDAIMEQVNIAASELDERHERYRIPPQGIMIETPAAAMISDILAEKVDFFSIGTNDLTQYTTALDRQAEGLERFYYPNHEAVFRLMELTVENAHKKGISVSICGEMGSDPQIIPRLYAMGIDELSMSPKKVRKAKSVLASMQQKEISSDDRTESIQMADGICAPVDGILVPMEEIRDEAFARGVLGKCIGIIPENGKIYAPCNGTVTMIAESFHAIGIHSDKGQDVLLHIGIDTVTLGGKGFHCNVRTGDTVTKGSLIMTADLELIKKAGLDTTVIIAVC